VLHRRAAALAKCALVAADEGRAIPCEAAPHFSHENASRAPYGACGAVPAEIAGRRREPPPGEARWRFTPSTCLSG
jgi:hypothetical protein